MLVLSRKQKESILIDDNVVVTVLRIHGGQVRIGIDAPNWMPVHRKEVYDRISGQEVAVNAVAAVGKSGSFQPVLPKELI